MKKVIIGAFVHVASFCSVLGLYFTIVPPNVDRSYWHWLLIGAGSLGTLIMAIYDICETWRSEPKKYRSQKKIKQYMCRWISSGGRTIVFSRNLTWVDTPDIKKLLIDKARARELTLFVQHSTPFTNQLLNEGARVVEYSRYGHVPESRFTIIDYGRGDARVAVGTRIGGVHTIQEHQKGHDPFYSVAQDLAELLLKLEDRSNDT